MTSLIITFVIIAIMAAAGSLLGKWLGEHLTRGVPRKDAPPRASSASRFKADWSLCNPTMRR